MADSKSENGCGVDRRDLLLQAASLAVSASANLLQAQQPVKVLAPFFEGFHVSKIDTTGASIHAVSGGQGHPVLLLHGYPRRT